MNQNKEIPLITFIMTPQCTDSDVDYLQHFDETQINKALEQKDHFADVSKMIEQKG